MEQKFIIRHSIFQLTSSRRGWRVLSLISNHHPVFQLTSSRRGWQYYLGEKKWEYTFQLTSSRRGWRGVPDWQAHKWGYFNSHPHEEDDVKAWYVISTCPISTHILTKRMTVYNCPSWTRTNISTHILTKRMTLRVLFLYHLYEYFNSHPHEEDDEFQSWKNISIFRISTHILTKRMTPVDALEWLDRLISTHILTKRMTKANGADGYAGDISTHILTKRMTKFLSKKNRCSIFQLTSSRRGWQQF